jgi:HSP20 family protein
MKSRNASHQRGILRISENSVCPGLGTAKAEGMGDGDPICAPLKLNMNAITPGAHDRLLAPLATIPACQKPNQEADWFPPVDNLEDTEEYLFKIDLPEVKAEKIQVTVEEERIMVSGERPNPWRDDRKHLRIERPHGYFERRFALSDDASREEISTLFAESVLEVHVRKVSPSMKTRLAASAPPMLTLHSAS